VDGVTSTPHSQPAPLFNSPVETSLRTLIVLEAMYPRPCRLSELTWFDHAVVHTNDLGGPPSLHPDLDSSVGELLVRRKLIEEALNLLQQLHLVEACYDEQGVTYLPGEESPALVELLSSPYNQRLRECAEWVANNFRELRSDEIEDVFADRVGRWTAEFQQAVPTR
jgi:hypothetical protein